MSLQQKRVEIKNFVKGSLPENKSKWSSEVVSKKLGFPLPFVAETVRMFRLQEFVETRQRCTECNHNWTAGGEFNCESCLLRKYSPVFYRGGTANLEPELRDLVAEEPYLEEELVCA